MINHPLYIVEYYFQKNLHANHIIIVPIRCQAAKALY